MALRNFLDWRSATYALVVVAGVGFYALGSPPALEALAYVPLVLVALSGVLVPVRERIPEHDRLLVVGLGFVGVYGLVVEGVSFFDALFALAGVAAVAALVYERVTGRSTRIA